MRNMEQMTERRTSLTWMMLGFILAIVPAATALAQTVTRGPYQQSGTPSSVIVRWRTSSSTDSVVRYGTTQGSLGLTASISGNRTEHEITVSGLTADTKYFYSIGNSSGALAGDDADHFFVTSPPTGTAKPTRLWILGDSGTANANARAVRDAFLSFTGSRAPDLTIMLGDNAYDEGTDSEYQDAVFDTYPTVLRQSVLWATVGNHDARSSANSNNETGPYYDIFTLPRNAEAGGVASGTEAYYSFDYGNIHFICLESFEINRSPTGAMMTWLEADLMANIQPWVIAFWHHPPYSKGSHNSDSESNLIDMRENALPILESWGVDLVLAGHSHSYERSFLLDGHYGNSGSLVSSMLIDDGDGRPAGNGAYTKPPGPSANDGAVYITAGSSGRISGGSLNHPAMFISLNQLGSMSIDIDGERLDASFINSTGGVTDTFTISKAPPAPPECGNNVREIGEVCDGTDLGGESCSSQGFATGTLACNATCSGFDTSACVALGNCGVIERFEGGFGGWANAAASTCSTGTFVVDTPTLQQTGTPVITTQIGGDHTTGSGNALFTATNTAPGTNDVDGGNCIVESPVYNITDASDLSLWYFHGQRDDADDPNGDFFRMEVLVNGNPTQLVDIGDVTTQAEWTEATLQVPGNSTVQVRVEVSDGSIGDIVEGGIDDLLICANGNPSVCGDQVAEAGEVCDGTDLVGETCVSQGFGGGTLACNATCDGFDTSACTAAPLCGNDQVDAGELCDGTDLGGESCVSQGFGGGTLDCNAACDAFDTSSCTPLSGCLQDVDFESGAGGWTNGVDSCTTGSFVLGTPDATDWQVAGGAGGSANAFFTQPNPGGVVGADDVDGGTCEALSASINASAHAAVSVSLDYFHGQRDADDDAGDGFTIEVLSDGIVVDTLVSLGDGTNNPAWASVSTTINNPGNIQLRVRASDPSGNGDIVEGGVDNVEICPTTQVICTVDEDFESGAAGWINSAASTCSTGTFVLGTPTQQTSTVTTQVGGDHSTGAGNAFFTATNTAAGSNDVDGGNCILESPTWNVSAASQLSIWYFHGQRDDGDDPAGDFFLLEVSTDGGGSYSPLVSIGDVTTSAAWTNASVAIPAGSNVKLRVQTSDGSSTGDIVEGGIDDLSICAQ